MLTSGNHSEWWNNLADEWKSFQVVEYSCFFFFFLFWVESVYCPARQSPIIDFTI